MSNRFALLSSIERLEDAKFYASKLDDNTSCVHLRFSDLSFMKEEHLIAARVELQKAITPVLIKWKERYKVSLKSALDE